MASAEHCTFQDDGSVVVDSLFLIAPDVCGFLCLVPVFVMQYLMSFLVFFHHMEERAGCFTLIVFLPSCSGTCMLCVFPHSAVGWSMVCDCGISSVSWPYTHCLVFFCVISDGYTNIFY